MSSNAARLLCTRVARALGGSARAGGRLGQAFPLSSLASRQPWLPPQAPLPPARSEGSRAFSSAGSKELLKVLKSEIEHEKESFEVPEEVARGPPKPFKLEDKKGLGEIVLRRTYENEEITLHLPIQPENYSENQNQEQGGEEGEEGEGEERDQVPVLAAEIKISKNSDKPWLEIHVSIEGDSWFAHTIFFEEQTKLDTRLYTGPDISTLDDRLQALFDKYLLQRGFNAELAQYARSAIQLKEQREYMNWLQNMKEFIAE